MPSIFSFGKGEDALKQISSDAELQNLFLNFTQPADKKTVAETGEVIMLLLYGGQSGITLDKLRFHLFQKGLQPRTLPLYLNPFHQRQMQ